MEEPLILCIETSLAVPSVAICHGKAILSEINIGEKNKAAEELHTIINKACTEAGIDFNQLNAVAVSGGPGSYTGLRIGVAAAKGICYALNLPLIHIETMQIMHHMTKDILEEGFDTCIAMIDARRNDAFVAIMDTQGNYLKTPEVVTLEANVFNYLLQAGKAVLIGDAVHKYANTETSDFFRIHIQGIPAGKMAGLARKRYLSNDLEDIAYYEPLYYKEAFITKKIR